MKTMLILTIPLILLSLPILFQLYFGYKAINRLIGLKFGYVCYFSYLSLIVFTIIGFIISMKGLSAKGFKCLTPATGIIGFAFYFFLGLTIIIVVQLLSKVSSKDKSEK